MRRATAARSVLVPLNRASAWRPAMLIRGTGFRLAAIVRNNRLLHVLTRPAG
jgi:hypothetical protein